MSTTWMPSDRAAESFTDLVTGMLDDATRVTRVTTQAYLKGLEAVVEQQKLARESSRQWASQVATIQTDLGRQATRSATRAENLAAATADGPATWNSDGYEALNAAEVIEKLPGFSQRDLREVESHEKAHQARQTVLQRIESLRGREPVPGYDELTVPEVQAQLDAGDAARAASIRDYERSHKKREGVLRAAQAHLDDA